MRSCFLVYKSSSIHYCQSGNSSKPLLLCFHGYGESAASFDFFEKYLGEDFTIIAIDLPFHGKTDWKEGLNFTPGDLLAITRELMQRSSGDASKAVLIGFSMGARVALGLLEMMPQQVTRIVLLSPDGLTMNGWYWLSTQTKLGNLLFKTAMHTPGLLQAMLRLARILRLVNRGIYTFIHHFIHTKEKRVEVYTRWTTMRRIRPNLPAIKSLVRDDHIRVKLLYGRYDHIIRFERGEKFKEGIEPYTEIRVIEAGHLVLQEKNIASIVALLKN